MFAGKENGIVFSAQMVLRKALSDFRFTERSVLLPAVPLPQALRMGDGTPVSSQG